MPDPREQLLRDLGYTEKAIAFIVGEVNVGEIDEPSVAVRHQGHCGDIRVVGASMAQRAGGRGRNPGESGVFGARRGPGSGLKRAATDWR